MKELTVKMIGFCFLVILVTNWVVSQVGVLRFKNFDPCSVNHIHQNLSEYNVLFVGSSRFGRQIDAKLFDSINVNLNYRSFNYSFDAAFAPTSINLANTVLAQPNNNLKVLILELTPIEFMGELDQGFVTRSVNWYSLDDFIFLLRSGSGASLCLVNQVGLVFNRFYLIAHRMFSIGEFWKRIALSKENCKSANYKVDPLPEAIKTSELLHELNDIRQANTTDKLKSYNLDLTSSSYLNALSNLNEKCQRRGIKLITVVTPKLAPSNIHYVESLAKLLNQENVIRLNNSDEYPALYSAALTADSKHINSKGIRPFTEYLSLRVEHILHQKTVEQDESDSL